MSTIECGICFLQYDEEERTPRILTNCGHTICQECATKLSTDGRMIACPFDRNVTVLLGYGGVPGLQKNFALLDLSRKANQEPKQKTHAPCFENPSHEAVVYCLQCEVEFCDECYTSVHKAKALSSHKKINISEKPLKLPKCPKHPHNIAEFFCTDPECTNPTKIMCQTCVLFDQHKSHKHDFLMDKLLENEQMLQQAVEARKLLQEMGEMVARIVNQTLASYDVTGKEFKNAVKVISDQFDMKKREAISELTQFANEKKEEEMEHQRVIEKKFRKMKELDELIETLKITNDLQSKDKIDDWMRSFKQNTVPKTDSKCDCRFLKDYEFIVPDIKLQIKEKPDVSSQPILKKYMTDLKLKYPEFLDD
ncbi:unnamed protein product [Caenorhabditis brenneri]